MLRNIFLKLGTIMELKFIDGVSRTFFPLGILNGEACPMCIYKL